MTYNVLNAEEEHSKDYSATARQGDEYFDPSSQPAEDDAHLKLDHLKQAKPTLEELEWKFKSLQDKLASEGKLKLVDPNGGPWKPGDEPRFWTEKGFISKQRDPWEKTSIEFDSELHAKVEAAIKEMKMGGTRVVGGGGHYVKETNPKDAVGITKPPISCVSFGAVGYLGLAMAEGARKYGAHNYRVAGVRPSVYVDAAWRHLSAYWDFSQDTDPQSGLPHLAKAMACLAVLLDATLIGKLNDDRPPPLPLSLLDDLQKKMDELRERYPTSVPAFTREANSIRGANSGSVKEPTGLAQMGECIHDDWKVSET